MDLLTLLLFVPASFALNMAPGPNNFMSMNNAKRYGLKAAGIAGVGRLLAFVLMISLAASGLAGILYASEKAFLAIKVIGAGYLFWLAFNLWTTDVGAADEGSMKNASQFSLVRQEFYVALGNPKAILIFTAFFPQFIDLSQNVTMQFAVLGALFLVLEFTVIMVYGYIGCHLRDWFAQPKMRSIFNRSSAGLLASAGVGILLARRD